MKFLTSVMLAATLFLLSSDYSEQSDNTNASNDCTVTSRVVTNSYSAQIISISFKSLQCQTQLEANAKLNSVQSWIADTQQQIQENVKTVTKLIDLVKFQLSFFQ